VTVYYALELSKTRTAELRCEASRARLAAIAACCRPSTWDRAARRALDAAAQLGRKARRNGSPPAPPAPR
jgi:hypothetical protein